MHCLNLTVATNFSNAKTFNPKVTRIVACNSGTSGQGSGSEPVQGLSFPRTETYGSLKQKLEVAVKSEDFKEAARIRELLKLFEEEDPVLRLRRLLKESIAEERFKDAAKYRNELKEIAPHCFLKCSSDATTLGIRVQVRSVYIEGPGDPSKGLYSFAYNVRITSNSYLPVVLLRAHWIITDANGKSESLYGFGVVGPQPLILPDASFEHSSVCTLSTPSGRMEGDYEMKLIDMRGALTFNVPIAPISLSAYEDSIDAI